MTRYNPPSNWPTPPSGWQPPPDWQPDPSWGPPPHDHQFWVDDPQQPPAREQRGKAVTITALILAGIALILCWIPIVNNAVFFLGLIAVVLAVIALVITLRGRSMMRGMAVASLVVGVLSLVGVLATQALYASVLAGASAATEGFPEGKISDPTSTSAPAPDGTTRPVTTSPAPVEPAAVAPEPTPTEDGPAKLGQTFTYNDGMSITVAAPTAAFASDTSMGAKETGGQIRIFTVTITNGTEKVFDPSMVMADVNYGPDGTPAERVFDSAQNLGSGFEGKILPGKKQVAKLAFAVPHAPQEVLISIAPSWDHDDALFIGK